MTSSAFTISDDQLPRFAPLYMAAPPRAAAAAAAPPAAVDTALDVGATRKFRLATAVTDYGVGEVSRASPWHEHTTSNFKVRRLLACVA